MLESEIICLLIIAATVLVWKWMSLKCKHEWEIIKTVHVNSDDLGEYDRIYLRCKKCGAVKCKTMM